MAQRQIRALYTDKTITVYQAYSAEIADAAVSAQKLSASPAFKVSRMTWIKPSWCWMMYRSGYAQKDKNQTRILALRMKHVHFQILISLAQLAHQQQSEQHAPIIIQWDPERNPRLEKLDYRSIQIGISASLVQQWIHEWIEAIEDVTWMAVEMKSILDEDSEGVVGLERLRELGVMPNERVYVVDDDGVKDRLRMD